MNNFRALNNTISLRAVVADGDTLRISGYANKLGVVDSYGTRFDPKSIILERFRKNPVLLFNHDVDKVIGKVTKVEEREDGIYVEAEISNSSAPHVAYVRDLIREGCLKAFSIRFGGDCQMEKQEDGSMLIRNWELQELSVVSLPAQPESLFSLRMLKSAFRNVTSLEEAKHMLDKVRGAKAAAYVNECITVAAESVSEDDVMERLRDRSGLEAGELTKVLDGEVTPLPESFISAAVEVLNCDKDKLVELNAVDVEASKEGGESPAAVEPDALRAKEDAMQACVSEKIPMLIKEGKEQEQAVAMAISMCKEQGRCAWTPTQEQMAHFLRQADEVSTPVTSEVPNDNAMLQKLDSVVSLLGAVVTELKGVKAELANLVKAPEAREDIEIEIKPDSEEKPEEEPEEMTPEQQRTISELFAKVEQRIAKLSV